MADPVKKRKAHVKRIFLDDRTGRTQSDPGSWVDVMRIDELPVRFQSKEAGVQGQIITFKFHWNDDPENPNNALGEGDYQQEDAVTSRKTEAKKIYANDGTIASELRIISKMKVMMPQGSPVGKAGQIVNFKFGNTSIHDPDARPSKRKTTVVKVFNTGLGPDDQGNIIDMGKIINGKLVGRIVDWDSYKQALLNGNVNDGGPKYDNVANFRHLNLEITDNFLISFQADADDPAGKEGQIIKYVLQNKELEPDDKDNPDGGTHIFKKLGDLDAKDDDGNYTVIRLDPLQTIVNFSVNPPDFFVRLDCAGSYTTTDTDHDTGAPEGKPPIPIGDLRYNTTGKPIASLSNTLVDGASCSVSSRGQLVLLGDDPNGPRKLIKGPGPPASGGGGGGGGWSPFKDGKSADPPLTFSWDTSKPLPDPPDPAFSNISPIGPAGTIPPGPPLKVAGEIAKGFSTNMSVELKIDGWSIIDSFETEAFHRFPLKPVTDTWWTATFGVTGITPNPPLDNTPAQSGEGEQGEATLGVGGGKFKFNGFSYRCVGMACGRAPKGSDPGQIVSVVAGGYVVVWCIQVRDKDQ
jgi:hypothetical protein